MADLNHSKVIAIAGESDLAREVFKILSDMGKPRPTTDLGRFKVRLSKTTGKLVAWKDLLKVFESLHKAGVGKLVLSRDLQKAPHRFDWAYNNVQVGEVGANVAARGPGPVTSPTPSQAANALVISYPIRGQLYPLQIPADLSKTEARELGEFISRFGR